MKHRHSLTTDGHPLLPILLGLVLGVRSILALFVFGFEPVDDTYITFRYARNLVEGYGLVYNLGESVLGTTSPLWALLLAGASVLGLSIPQAAFGVSIVADAVTSVLIIGLMQRLGASRGVAYAAALVFLFQMDYLTLARTGMETAFFLCLTTATLYGVAHYRWRLAGGLAVMAVLTRPEGGLLVIVVLVMGYVFVRRTGQWSPVLQGIGIMAGLGGLWLAYAVYTYGSPIPHSIVAKAHNTSEATGRFWLSTRNLAMFFAKGQLGHVAALTPSYLQGNLVLTMCAAVGGGATLVRVLRRRAGALDRLMVLGFFPVVFVSGYAASSAFTWYDWYYGPLYLFLSIWAVLGVSVLAAWGRRAHRRQQWAVGAVVVLLGLGQCWATLTVKMKAPEHHWVSLYREVVAEVPRDPHVRVATAEIGVVGWEVWPAHVDDLAGLVNPALLETGRLRYVEKHAPDYLVARTDNARRFFQEAEETTWFSEQYRLVRRLEDPNRSRAFVLYQARSSPYVQKVQRTTD